MNPVVTYIILFLLHVVVMRIVPQHSDRWRCSFVFLLLLFFSTIVQILVLMFYFTDEAMSQGGNTGVRRLRIIKDCACHWCQFRSYVRVIEY